MIKTSVTNLIFRGMTLASKFVLMVLMARLLDPVEVGVYGLMVVTIAISLFLLGMDFYAFNTRELLERRREDWPRLIRDQLAFHGAMYILALPLLSAVFFSGLLEWSYAIWFYGLVILEHLSQESFRLLVTMSRSAIANAVLFLRSGCWVLAVAALWWLEPTTRNLEAVWTGWLIGIVLSLALAVFAVRDLPWHLVRTQPVRWQWIRNGVRIALPLLTATICLQGVQFADRYLIAHLSEADLLGVYTFFGGVANVMHVFVFSAVTMVLHPRIVQAYRTGDYASYRHQMRKMIGGTVICLLAIGTVLAIGIKPVLTLISREIYSQHLTTYYILLIAFGVLACSHLPHYALYARKADASILISSIVALCAAVGMGVLLIPTLGIMGAALATLGAATVLGGSKLAFLIAGSRTRPSRTSSLRFMPPRVEKTVQ